MPLTNPPVPGDPIIASGFGVDVAGSGFLGDASSGGQVPLDGSPTYKGGLAVVQFTLDRRRRVKVEVDAAYQQSGTTNAVMSLRAALNSGTTVNLGLIHQLGAVKYVGSTLAGTQGIRSGSARGTDVLDGGTYIAYALVSRLANGSVTDFATQFYTAVYAVGNG